MAAKGTTPLKLLHIAAPSSTKLLRENYKDFAHTVEHVCQRLSIYQTRLKKSLKRLIKYLGTWPYHFPGGEFSATIGHVTPSR